MWRTPWGRTFRVGGVCAWPSSAARLVFPRLTPGALRLLLRLLPHASLRVCARARARVCVCVCVCVCVGHWGTEVGLRIAGSLFEANDGNASVVLDERRRRFTGVTDTVIERGAARLQPSGPGRRLLGTRASRTLAKRNTTTFEFDFAGSLVFGSIQEVRYSLSLDAGMFARSAARWTPGTAKVVVETDVAVSGSCTVDVDESKRDEW